MTDKKEETGWVYVFVSDPGPSENFLGLYNNEKEINFIPAFQTKEEANDCFLTIPREKGKKYELQAVHVEEIYDIAKENGFVVAIVDADGKVVKE